MCALRSQEEVNPIYNTYLTHRPVVQVQYMNTKQIISESKYTCNINNKIKIC